VNWTATTGFWADLTAGRSHSLAISFYSTS
jgi:hypothetical protein